MSPSPVKATVNAASEYTRFDESRMRRMLNLPNANPDELAQAMATRLSIRYYPLESEIEPSAKVVRTIPEPLACKFGLFPVSMQDNVSVTVAMVNPTDVEALDAVQVSCGLEVRKGVSTRDRVFAAIKKYYNEDAFAAENLQDLMSEESFSFETASAGEDEDGDDGLNEAANEAPVVRFVNLILINALKAGASDIHFEPGEYTTRIRMRIDGRLEESPPPARNMYDAIVTRIKILSNMDISERRIPQDGRLKFRMGTKTVDVRVNTLPEVHGEKIVMRILDRDSLVVELADMGFEGKILADFRRILSYPHGIILVTGPTGSGKSTTLYGALNHLNTDDVNIQTVEDPVEYQLQGINQCAIRSNVGLTFASALRAILRQDPDVIMIGEMRDKETSEIAMRSALTGHLVLSTLHTNDATSSFSRMLDMGVPDYLIASTIKLVLAQRLVRRLCKHCKREVPPDPDHVTVISRLFPDAGEWIYYEPVGCEHCRQIGYRGRCAVFEFLEVTSEIKEMIHPEVSDLDLRKTAIDLGMETLETNGFRQIKAGITTFSEIMKIAAGSH
jgi:type II secretory ATPase GspE/PulE/Tfp pilus assembly ATPase PilB-like protein